MKWKYTIGYAIQKIYHYQRRKKDFQRNGKKAKKKIGLLQEMIDEQKSEEKVNHPKRQINEEEFE